MLTAPSTIQLSDEQEQHASRLHAASLVIDGSSVVNNEPGHIERFRAGGVTATNHTVTNPASGTVDALREINTYRRWIDANRENVLLASTVADIRTAKETGREAIIFGPQNTDFLGTDLNLLGTFYDVGVRVMQLTYQRQNAVGSGCGERRDAGLSTFGRELVAEMDAMGIVVDLSHCGAVTAADAIATSRNPVIFSHAHPAAIAPHIRAKDDDLLRALAAGGGVIGITALSAFLYDPDKPKERPGLPSFVKHLRYLIDLIGIDHVSIGLDFDETITYEKWEADHKRWPELQPGWSFEERRCRDLTSAAEAGNVTRALVADGFTDDEIQKILGLNLLRVFEQVWQGGTSTQGKGIDQ
ncbi:MAG: membrane dipeptidase [Chloroflexota bacterium]